MTIKCDIEPQRGVGPFIFGMLPHEVRQAAGTNFKSFKRSTASVHPTDYFGELGVFANYAADGHLEAVELAAPFSPTLDGTSLLEVPLSELVSILEKLDVALESNSDGFVSTSLGISVYVPNAKEEANAYAESILVFEAGYYT